MVHSSRRQHQSPSHGFGKRLAQARREKGVRDHRDIGQLDVARAIGSNRSSLSRWEAGGTPPNDDVMGKLAAYLEVSPAWLRYGLGPIIPPITDGYTPVAEPVEPRRRKSNDG